MITAGLCSVTLRALSVEDVAAVAARAGLAAVEWGGDVHVPPGDAGAVRRAVAVSAAHGLTVASYGSYLFALGVEPDDAVRRAVDTAAALGAPHLRVWAGFDDAVAAADRPLVVEGIARCAALAAEVGIDVGIEFHGGTPTATVAGTVALLAAIDAPNVRSLWQPPYWRGPTAPEADAAEVRSLGARLGHLHVYEWSAAGVRLPLAAGRERWAAVLAAVPTGDRTAFLEFVADDDPDRVVADAAELGRLLTVA